MTPLTSSQIETFASMSDAKRIAVENFLFSMPTDLTYQEQIQNCANDVRAYKWNRATAKAIYQGIALAYSKNL